MQIRWKTKTKQNKGTGCFEQQKIQILFRIVVIKLTFIRNKTGVLGVAGFLHLH